MFSFIGLSALCLILATSFARSEGYVARNSSDTAGNGVLSASPNPPSSAGPPNRFGPSDRLAKHVPFPIDDFDSVNELFTSYSVRQAPAELRTIEIWTYCFVRRYFVGKCLHDAQSTASDLEAMIEIAFRKIRKNRHNVRTGKYANWVCVVCRNSFLNYIRGRRTTVSLDELMLTGQRINSETRTVPASRTGWRSVQRKSVPGIGSSAPVDRAGSDRLNVPRMVAEPDVMQDWDADRCRLAVEAAIGRLPEYLREVATLKILEGRSYAEIESRVEKPTPILRAYVHRIVLRLREDQSLLRFFSDG